MWLYVSLVIWRVVWSILPQNGYIHPDEFFQSVEVVAGDALNITVEKTWEFQKEMPLRSMVINNILFMPTFYMLDFLSSTLHLFTLTGRILLSSSRVVMTLLSFILDYNVWRMCKAWRLDASSGIVMLSWSYVMLTYQTHSFSNAIESVLLVMVIGAISECHQRGSNIGSHENKDQLNKNNKTGDVVRDTAMDHGKGVLQSGSMNQDVRKRKKCIPTRLSHTHLSTQLVTGKEGTTYISTKEISREKRNFITNSVDVTITDCMKLALLNTMGIFNRPTFALFSVAPFVWWCYQMKHDKGHLVSRVSVFVAVSLLIAMIVCILDSNYYNGLELSDLFYGDDLLTRLVFTPWNFVKYNTNTSNLELHGRHPFFLHFLVNVPLLFGPLALVIFLGIFLTSRDIFNSMRNSCFSKKADSPDRTFRIYSSMNDPQKHILLFFIVIPLLCLSVFPHQEPRFLIPLLTLVVIYALQSAIVYKKQFITIYILYNILLSIMYGVLHQGGVIPCLFKLHELSALSEYSVSNTTVLFSHTYMPPKHLLLLKDTSNMTIIDLKGGDLDKIQSYITSIRLRDTDSGDIVESTNLLLAIPGTIITHLQSKLESLCSLTVIGQFYPHLTLEDPPEIPRNIASVGRLVDDLSLFLLKVNQ